MILGMTFPGLFLLAEINTEAKAGVRNTASSIETIIAMESVDANALKNIPGTPVRNTRGIKTTSVVSVAPNRGEMISPVAVTTASFFE